MNASAKRPTFYTMNGITYRVRKVRTHSFRVWLVGGEWVTPTGPNASRTVANYNRLQVPSLTIHTTSTTLVLNGKCSFLTVTTATGEYHDCEHYLGDLTTIRGCISDRFARFITLTSHLS